MSNDAARAAGSYAPACSASVPEWVAEEIKATWQAARDAGGEMQAFRIIERMVDRLGYGRMKNNPSLVPNNRLSGPLLQIYKGMRGQKVLCPRAGEQRKGTVLRGVRVSGVAPESYSR